MKRLWEKSELKVCADERGSLESLCSKGSSTLVRGKGQVESVVLKAGTAKYRNESISDTTRQDVFLLFFRTWEVLLRRELESMQVQERKHLTHWRSVSGFWYWRIVFLAQIWRPSGMSTAVTICWDPIHPSPRMKDCEISRYCNTKHMHYRDGLPRTTPWPVQTWPKTIVVHIFG